MYAKISEEGVESKPLKLKLDEDGCISLDYLQSLFPDATGLSYVDAAGVRYGLVNVFYSFF
jgi:hypothetical protein